MRRRADTIQVLDPLGAIAIRPLAIVAVAVAVVYAIVMTLVGQGELVHPVLAVVAVVMLAVAATVATVATSPYRAPFRGQVFAGIVALSTGAMAAAAWSTWGLNENVRFDWGPIAAGLIILACASFRPARDLVFAGVAVAIIAGVLATGQAEFVRIAEPPLVVAVTAATTVLALSLGAAAFVRVMLRTLRIWRLRATDAAQLVALDSADALARSVQQDRVTTLNRDVVPFFAQILAAGAITDGDRERARDLSGTFRDVMVADMSRSWLAIAVEQAGATLVAQRVGAECVSDDDRLADSMTPDQRTATRALLTAMLAQPGFEADGFAIRLRLNGAECSLEWRARVSESPARIRAALTPYLSVVGVVFDQLRLDITQPEITVRFSYEFA